jgi:hypothetical protein
VPVLGSHPHPSDLPMPGLEYANGAPSLASPVVTASPPSMQPTVCLPTSTMSSGSHSHSSSDSSRASHVSSNPHHSALSHAATIIARERGVKRERTPPVPLRVGLAPRAGEPNLSPVIASPSDLPTSPYSTRLANKKAKHADGAAKSDPLSTRTLNRPVLLRHESEPISGHGDSASVGSSSAAVSPLLQSFSRLTHHRRVHLTHSLDTSSPARSTDHDSPASSPSFSSRKDSPKSASVTPSSRRRSVVKREISVTEMSSLYLSAPAEPLPLPLESDGVITGSGNGLAAGVTIPKPVPGKRGGGFSCHCCKTSKRNIDELFLCTNILPKNPNSSASVLAARLASEALVNGSNCADLSNNDSPTSASTTKRCKKKYCIACLRRLYPRELLALRGPNEDQWTCPSCLNRCSCAGCERKVAGHSEAPWRRKKKDKDAAGDTGITTGRKRAPSSKPRVRRASKAKNEQTGRVDGELEFAHDHELEGDQDESMEHEHEEGDPDQDQEDQDPDEEDEVDEEPEDDDGMGVDEVHDPIEASLQAEHGLDGPFEPYSFTSTNTMFQLPTTPNTTTLENFAYPAPAPSGHRPHSHSIHHQTAPAVGSGSGHSANTSRSHSIDFTSLASSQLQPVAVPHGRSMTMSLDQRRLDQHQLGINMMQIQVSSMKEEERSLLPHQQRLAVDESHLPTAALAMPSSHVGLSDGVPDADLEMMLMEKHRRLLQQQRVTNMLLQQIQAQKAQHQRVQHQHQQQQQAIHHQQTHQLQHHHPPHHPHQHQSHHEQLHHPQQVHQDAMRRQHMQQQLHHHHQQHMYHHRQQQLHQQQQLQLPTHSQQPQSQPPSSAGAYGPTSPAADRATSAAHQHNYSRHHMIKPQA